jgi:hypothetical protein
MQRLGSLNSPIKEAKVFIRDICKLKVDDVDEAQRLIAYREWLLSLDFSIEKAPISFNLDGKEFSTCHLVLKKKKHETLLNMQLAFLYELINLKIDPEKYKAIDNVAALIYREDWSKPFNQTEYFENALMFEKSKCKFSLWGMQKFNELIVILKDTYPILYQGNNEDKEDGRKMYDMINAISGDVVSNQKAALEVEIFRAFEWMEAKKIESIKRKLNKR